MFVKSPSNHQRILPGGDLCRFQRVLFSFKVAHLLHRKEDNDEVDAELGL